MKWTKAETPPEMSTCDYGWMSSTKVLVCEVGGGMRVATYEQIDEDCEPRWYSACSERWGLNRVTHWMPLPEAPNAALTGGEAVPVESTVMQKGPKWNN